MEILMKFINNTCVKFAPLKLLDHLPGSNELTEHSDLESVCCLPGDFSGLLAPDRVWLMISLSYVVFVPLRVIEQEAATFV